MVDEKIEKKQNFKWLVAPYLLQEVVRFENLYGIIDDKPLLICGPSGIGKSLFVHVFECLYKENHDCEAKVQRLNCAAFNRDLILWCHIHYPHHAVIQPK